jgi:hypothetical protein
MQVGPHSAPMFFTHLFYRVEGVREFQVIQKTRMVLHIMLAVEPTFDPVCLQILEGLIHTVTRAVSRGRKNAGAYLRKSSTRDRAV